MSYHVLSSRCCEFSFNVHHCTLCCHKNSPPSWAQGPSPFTICRIPRHFQRRKDVPVNALVSLATVNSFPRVKSINQYCLNLHKILHDEIHTLISFKSAEYGHKFPHTVMKVCLFNKFRLS